MTRRAVQESVDLHNDTAAHAPPNVVACNRELYSRAEPASTGLCEDSRLLPSPATAGGSARPSRPIRSSSVMRLPVARESSPHASRAHVTDAGNHNSGQAPWKASLNKASSFDRNENGSLSKQRKFSRTRPAVEREQGSLFGGFVQFPPGAPCVNRLCQFQTPPPGAPPPGGTENVCAGVR
jgi:hypothetical protein